MDLMNNYNESTTSDDIGSPRNNGGEAMAAAATSSNKLPSSRYKGVVPQPNGRWGAQIYDKHQRVWLGTFNEEQEAAKAYGIASLRFRGGDAVTNFDRHHLKPYIDKETETLFLKSHAKAEIVDMLRKHSYDNELESYRHNLYNNNNNVIMECDIDLMGGTCHDRREWLFEKVATPSDVGRLNRMVIPKQQAEKHFQVNNGGGGDDLGLLCKGVLMNFEDEGGKVWRFRYCYWGSSQSYVLTKGWTRFVKEKRLRAGDVVRFERSMGEDRRMFIECRPRNGGGSGFGEPSTSAAVAEDLEAVQDEGVVRLFGVNIVDACSSCIVDNSRCLIEAWSEN